jgi:hypothetical protein
MYFLLNLLVLELKNTLFDNPAPLARLMELRRRVKRRASRKVGDFAISRRFLPGAKVEFVFAQEGVSSIRAFLLDARNSFGYSSFDKSNSASGIGMVAVTVVPP